MRGSGRRIYPTGGPPHKRAPVVNGISEHAPRACPPDAGTRCSPSAHTGESSTFGLPSAVEHPQRLRRRKRQIPERFWQAGTHASTENRKTSDYVPLSVVRARLEKPGGAKPQHQSFEMLRRGPCPRPPSGDRSGPLSSAPTPQTAPRPTLHHGPRRRARAMPWRVCAAHSRTGQPSDVPSISRYLQFLSAIWRASPAGHRASISWPTRTPSTPGPAGPHPA